MIKGETLNQPTTVYVILIDRHLSSFQSNVIPHYFLNYSFFCSYHQRNLQFSVLEN